MSYITYDQAKEIIKTRKLEVIEADMGFYSSDVIGKKRIPKQKATTSHFLENNAYVVIQFPMNEYLKFGRPM